MEALIVIGMTILVFLVMRQLVLWYWKVNAIEALLTEIRDELREQKRKTLVS